MSVFSEKQPLFSGRRLYRKKRKSRQLPRQAYIQSMEPEPERSTCFKTSYGVRLNSGRTKNTSSYGTRLLIRGFKKKVWTDAE